MSQHYKGKWGNLLGVLHMYESTRKKRKFNLDLRKGGKSHIHDTEQIFLKQENKLEKSFPLCMVGFIPFP